MRCPSCQAECPDPVVRCPKCRRRLGSGRRAAHALADEADTPWGKLGEGPNRPARLAYHLAVLGLVPGVGLALGPAAFAVGLYAQLRGRSHPAFNAGAFSRTSIGLGLAEGLTNWAGLALMVSGWR
jgi:hypothetical protein